MTIAAVPVNAKAGKDAYAYVNVGSHVTPSWTEAGNVQDVKLGDAITLYELKLRTNRPFSTNVPTLLGWNPSFKMSDLAGDALMAGIIAAKAGGTCIDMLFLDGVAAPAAGITSQGMRADWCVEKADRSESSDEAVMYDVSLKPGQTANVPSWTSITGS
jgi:hypothetical protein